MHTERDVRNDTKSERLCENYKLLLYIYVGASRRRATYRLDASLGVWRRDALSAHRARVSLRATRKHSTVRRQTRSKTSPHNTYHLQPFS